MRGALLFEDTGSRCSYHGNQPPPHPRFPEEQGQPVTAMETATSRGERGRRPVTRASVHRTNAHTCR